MKLKEIKNNFKNIKLDIKCDTVCSIFWAEYDRENNLYIQNAHTYKTNIETGLGEYIHSNIIGDSGEGKSYAKIYYDFIDNKNLDLSMPTDRNYKVTLSICGWSGIKRLNILKGEIPFNILRSYQGVPLHLNQEYTYQFDSRLEITDITFYNRD